MKLLFIVSTAFLICFSSCKKEAANTLSATSSSVQNASSIYTLTLQPGPKDGDDLWMKNWLHHPAYADTCDYKVALIKGLAYNLNGSTVYTRSVIKFDSLSKLPAGATIKTATLYLYGPTPKSKDVKVHLPMGNTSYPGSKKGDNTCFLQRITSTWNVNSISWNNPPSITTNNQCILAASNKQWQYDAAIDVTGMIKTMTATQGSNNGFLLRLKTEIQPRAMGFLSADSPEASRRPKLVVTYSL